MNLRQSAVSRASVGRQSAVSRPFEIRQSAVSPKVFFLKFTTDGPSVQMTVRLTKKIKLTLD